MQGKAIEDMSVKIMHYRRQSNESVTLHNTGSKWFGRRIVCIETTTLAKSKTVKSKCVGDNALAYQFN